MKDQFLRWWKSQTPHDRKLWIAIAACVLIGLFYFCVYHPLVSWQDRNYTKNTRLKSDVKWISTNYQALEKISSAAKKNSAAGGTSIQSAVEKTVKKYLITVTRMQNSGASQVSVSLGDVEFPSLMKWAADLEQNWHIRVSSIDIVGMGQGGVKVNRIVLEKNEN